MRGENRRDACLSSCLGGPGSIFHGGFSGVFLLDVRRCERHEKHWYGLHSGCIVSVALNMMMLFCLFVPKSKFQIQ